MYDSIRDIVGIQFGELYHYDLTTVLQEELSAQQKTQVEACLFENEEVRQSMYVQQESMEVKAPSGKAMISICLYRRSRIDWILL